MDPDEQHQLSDAVTGFSEASADLTELVTALIESLEPSAKLDAFRQHRALTERLWASFKVAVHAADQHGSATPAVAGASELREALSLALTFYTGLKYQDGDAMASAFAPVTDAFYDDPAHLHALAQALLQLCGLILVSANNHQIDVSSLVDEISGAIPSSSE
jgi:hypothetical protein